MTQMNELNATKLSMEELENVNGGSDSFGGTDSRWLTCEKLRYLSHRLFWQKTLWLHRLAMWLWPSRRGSTYCYFWRYHRGMGWLENWWKRLRRSYYALLHCSLELRKRWWTSSITMCPLSEDAGFLKSCIFSFQAFTEDRKGDQPETEHWPCYSTWGLMYCLYSAII